MGNGNKYGWKINVCVIPTNTLKEIFFQIVERLEILLKITIKRTLNLKLGGVLSFFLVVNFYLFIYLLIIIIVICLGCFVNPP